MRCKVCKFRVRSGDHEEGRRALAFLLLLLVMIRTIRPRIANRSPNPIRRGSDWPLG